MTQLTRRNFLKQALLLPAAAVLPALPKVTPPTLPGIEAAIWSDGELISCEPAWAFPESFSLSLGFENMGRSIFEGLKMGLEANVNDLLAATRPVVFAMTEQIYNDIEGPAASGEWLLNCEYDDDYWAAQETYWGRFIQ